MGNAVIPKKERGDGKTARKDEGYMQPAEIESRSFAIIDEEAGPHDFPADEWSVVRRMIHTTADFAYMTDVRLHPKALSAGVAALRRGGNVVCDTRMLFSGVRRAAVNAWGGEVICRIGDPDIRQAALASGGTRAKAAVEAAVDQMAGGVYAVGNAPTALLRLMELIREGRAAPSLIIGLPVGFVNAAESKAELLEMEIPFISNKGRKGGSNVAAAVVNALILLAQKDEGAAS